MTSEQLKRGLFLSIVASVVVGLLLAWHLYGNLVDVLSWNVIGLMFILFVGGYTLSIGLRSFLESRKAQR